MHSAFYANKDSIQNVLDQRLAWINSGRLLCKLNNIKTITYYKPPATESDQPRCYTRTIPVFELDLHFHPNYTSPKFHVCISNGCNTNCANESLLTQWNKQTLPKYSQPLMVVQNHCLFVDTQRERETDRQTRWKQHQLSLSRLVVNYILFYITGLYLLLQATAQLAICRNIATT